MGKQCMTNKYVARVRLRRIHRGARKHYVIANSREEAVFMLYQAKLITNKKQLISCKLDHIMFERLHQSIKSDISRVGMPVFYWHKSKQGTMHGELVTPIEYRAIRKSHI